MKKTVFALAALLLLGCREPIKIGVSGLPLGTVITVDTTEDALTVNGNCSLREAFRAAMTNTAQDGCPAGTNSMSEPDQIQLPAGEYVFAVSGTNEDASLSGDLDAYQSFELIGAGRDSTTLNPDGLDAALHLKGSNAAMTGVVSGISFRDVCPNAGGCTSNVSGRAALGGIAYVNTPGTFIFDDIRLESGHALGGTGISVCSAVDPVVLISNFEAYGATCGNEGGCAVHAHTGGVTIEDSHFHDLTANGNEVTFGGVVGFYSSAGHKVLEIEDTVIEDSHTSGSGAIGARATGSGNSTEIRVTGGALLRNTAAGSAGNAYANGGAGGTLVGWGNTGPCGGEGCLVVLTDVEVADGVADSPTGYPAGSGGNLAANPTGAVPGRIELRGTTTVEGGSDLSSPSSPDCYGAVALYDASSVADTTNCAIEDNTTCGNMTIDTGEDCDGGECCTAQCLFAVLGTGCDDADACTGMDACDGAGGCEGETPECGNGAVELCEACDDDNTTSHDGCSASCAVEACVQWE